MLNVLYEMNVFMKKGNTRTRGHQLRRTLKENIEKCHLNVY